MTNSDAGARVIAGLGAAVAQVSAFDAPALERALRESRAEAVIDELTAEQFSFDDGCPNALVGQPCR